jgi:putative DNA primase/helicase
MTKPHNEGDSVADLAGEYLAAETEDDRATILCLAGYYDAEDRARFDALIADAPPVARSGEISEVLRAEMARAEQKVIKSDEPTPLGEALTRQAPEPAEDLPLAEVEPAKDHTNGEAALGSEEWSQLPKGSPDPKAGVILEPSAPFAIARVFAARCCREGNAQVAWFWEDQFWRWNGKHYAPEAEGKIRGRVYHFLEGAKKKVKGQEVPFDPRPANVNEVLDGLKSGLWLSALPAAWLPDGRPAPDCAAFANGIVNVKSGESWNHTPKFWTHGALEFDWDPHAEAPRWEAFLEEIFPEDKESGQFIEEFLGCSMTDDIDFQKGAMCVGDPRSGKGTIAFVAERLVGSTACVGLDINSWLSGEKSAQVLLGKRLGVFGDVRLKPARTYGQNKDPGGLDHKSKGWLLNLTAGDKVTIPRMWDTAWTGVLPIKLMLLSNEVPNLNDKTLPTRFIKVHFPVSFLGREDPALKGKLLAELPGIAARCVRAYAEARRRGKFIEPASGLALGAEVEAKSDPFTAMARECFVPDPAGFVTKELAFFRFSDWCREHGQGDLRSEVSTKGRLFDRLRKVSGFAGLFETQPHGSGRGWQGLRLAKREEA